MLSILYHSISKISFKYVGFYRRLFLPGKKGKKKKGKTVGLMSFLADGGTIPTVPVKPLGSWVDEVEDEHGKSNLYCFCFLLFNSCNTFNLVLYNEYIYIQSNPQEIGYFNIFFILNNRDKCYLKQLFNFRGHREMEFVDSFFMNEDILEI